MDPEIRALEGGRKVARVRLATSERFFNKQTQSNEERTEWHTVTAWGPLADVIDKYVRKGSQLYIEGRLQTREWTDESGNKRYATDVVAGEMKMLGRRADSPAGTGQAYQAPAAPQGQPQPMTNEQIAASAVDDADDLPF